MKITKQIKQFISGLLIMLMLQTVFVSPKAGHAAINQAVPETSAQSAMVIDARNGQILFEQNSEFAVEVASISKLLTIYIVLQAVEKGDIALDYQVPISDYAYAVSQDYDVSNVPLRQDELYTVEELLESVVIALSNGSTIALAELVAGSEADFVELMKAYLNDWGIEGASIINATGLNASYDPSDATTIDQGPQNMLSAEAVAIISYHLLKDHPEILKHTQINRKLFKLGTSDEFEMTNYNLMLAGRSYEFEGVDGLLTGYSTKDGGSFVSTIARDDLRVISVVLGAEGTETRYHETKKLFDYVFSAYMTEAIINQGDEVTQISQIKVSNGEISPAPLRYGEALDLVVPVIDTAPRLEYEFIANDQVNDSGELTAPLDEGTVVGYVSINISDQAIRFLRTSDAYDRGGVPVEIAEAIEVAPWYSQTWQIITESVGNGWDSTRRFFTDIFN